MRHLNTKIILYEENIQIIYLHRTCRVMQTSSEDSGEIDAERIGVGSGLSVDSQYPVQTTQYKPLKGVFVHIAARCRGRQEQKRNDCPNMHNKDDTVLMGTMHCYMSCCRSMLCVCRPCALSMCPCVVSVWGSHCLLPRQ